jgi:hypothetical protein
VDLFSTRPLAKSMSWKLPLFSITLPVCVCVCVFVRVCVWCVSPASVVNHTEREREREREKEKEREREREQSSASMVNRRLTGTTPPLSLRTHTHKCTHISTTQPLSTHIYVYTQATTSEGVQISIENTFYL